MGEAAAGAFGTCIACIARVMVLPALAHSVLTVLLGCSQVPSLTGTMPFVVQVDGTVTVLWQNAARQATAGSESPQTCRQPPEYRAKTWWRRLPDAWSNSDCTQLLVGHWQSESGALPKEATARRRVPLAPIPEGPRGLTARLA